MAAVTTTASNGPASRVRPLENGDLIIYTLSDIDTPDTFTPFPLPVAGSVGAFPRGIYAWAVQSINAVDAPLDQGGSSLQVTEYGQNPVNVGDGVEMVVVYTPPTASAAAYFTFYCTAGSGLCYLYVWAK